MDFEDIRSCQVWIHYINQNLKPSNRYSEDQGISIYPPYVLAILVQYSFFLNFGVASINSYHAHHTGLGLRFEISGLHNPFSRKEISVSPNLVQRLHRPT
ncbi:hypothetical protein SCLCIDRAFT_1216473 [Scleroderma citrinum Foug A]|uniref:Uncharacterized protein n=1 Tax=Scleroderma citrinum Foug A TaxID=1036808 RepID=A0A0C2ZGH4_9AGAM|nr:hypothetical protein SCLCIDRAFT_1216473 [Scleroderma citrinum Foug A]